MRRRKRTLLAHPKRHLAATLYGLVGLGAAARAQQVLMPAPSYPTTPPAVEAEREGGAGYVGGFQSFLATAENPAYWLTWGPAVAHPHLTYSATYSSGVNTAPGQSTGSLVQSVTPGVTVNVGTHLVLDYEPTLTHYSSSQLRDTVNHAFTLSGGWSHEDWVYGLSQSYNFTGDPNAQTGTQTTVQSFDTGVNFSYRFNSSISSDTTLNQSITSADQFTSSTSWLGTEFINYQFFPTLTVGLGVIYGYDQESLGSDMMHEQLQGRISWRASRKISVSLNAGVEDRQFLDGGVSDVITPVFGASIQYAPAANTSLSLTANRATTPSILLSQASQNTSVAIGLSQRILKHFSFTANASYSQIEYLATTENLTQNYQILGQNIAINQAYLIPDRKDTAIGFNATLSWAIRHHMTFSLTYSYNRDNSSSAGLGYATSQEGFQFGYHF